MNGLDWKVLLLALGPGILLALLALAWVAWNRARDVGRLEVQNDSLEAAGKAGAERNTELEKLLAKREQEARDADVEAATRDPAGALRAGWSSLHEDPDGGEEP